MTIQRVALVAVGTAATIVLAACGDRETIKVDAKNTNANFVARDSTRSLGHGDVRILSTDSSVEVAVVGDSVIGGLGPATRQKVADATDTAKVSGSGFGANLEKMIKSKVAGALAHEIEFPISQISDVKYEEGTLRFYGTDGKPMHIFESSKRGSSDRTLFSPSDAQAFIDAYKARRRI